MRELAIIISDLYLSPADGPPEDRSSQGGSRTKAAAGVVALPGLEQALRFGRKSPIPGGWRPWLARWLGRDDLVRAAPAAIVAAAAGVAGRGAIADEPRAPASGGAAGAVGADFNASTWLATPVYLIASLTSLHLDPRSILQLSCEDCATLVEDFNRTFADSPFRLASTASGALLMHARDALNATATEPARALASELEASLPTGPDAAALRRLGAELEMWLHAHPLNEARTRRGELPVSTLWLWGGGATAGHNDGATATNAAEGGQLSVDCIFGSDPVLAGLLHLHGATLCSLPDRLPDPRAHPGIQRMAIVPEITSLLHANPHWTVFEALADLDRRFLAPALAELRRGATTTIVVIANDIQLRVERGDALKFWRRRPESALDALRSV